MTNKPMLSVEREVIEKALRDALTIRFDTDIHVTKLRALLDKPAAQHQGEPVAFEVDVSGYTILLAKTADKAEKTA